MFDIDDYCQHYFMRKEAGFTSMGASLFGKAFGRVGEGVTRHFGTSGVGRTIGEKLTSWGNSLRNWSGKQLDRERAAATAIATQKEREAAAAAAKATQERQVLENTTGTTTSTPKPTDTPEMVTARNEANATNNATNNTATTNNPAKGMGLGAKVGLGALGLSVPLAVGTGIGYHMGGSSQEPQYMPPSQLVGY